MPPCCDVLLKRLGHKVEGAAERGGVGTIPFCSNTTALCSNAATSCCRGRAVTGGQP